VACMLSICAVIAFSTFGSIGKEELVTAKKQA